MSLLDVKFVSVWSGAEYESAAKLDLNTGVVSQIQPSDVVPDDEGNTHLDECFVRYEDLEITAEESDDGSADYIVHAEDLGDLQALVSG